MVIFLLIAIFNSSLLNFGPNSNKTAHDINMNKDGLSFYYQNVQGLIPFTDLGKEHPNLDHTKIAELQQYVYTNSLDIVILNETWLKSTIHDEEMLSSNSYKIFRCDRTIFTHPPDLDNPLKFRKNGGGVLIAINSSLQLSSKEISLKCKAEMLAVEFMLNDNSKIVISTCYRVGTLGIPNFQEITRTLDILLRKKRLKKFFLIGDFNLRHANWETFSSSNSTEQTFINEFVRQGLIQCIFSPTHIKGNILDILLSNSDNFISDITTLSNNESCKSDHYAITFKVKTKVVLKKPIKTKSFNFKRANWDGLNQDLNNVDWLLTLDCLEPDIAWSKFKEILNHFQELHIPKVTIKLTSQPSWFDTDCYVKCREKERLHKKFKNTRSINDELKFVTFRREFKSLVRSKMRDDLYCSR